jgi:hypothetical protein
LAGSTNGRLTGFLALNGRRKPCAASHPDFNRRSRSFTESTSAPHLVSCSTFGSWTITTGSDSHRPRSTFTVYQPLIPAAYSRVTLRARLPTLPSPAHNSARISSGAAPTAGFLRQVGSARPERAELCTGRIPMGPGCAPVASRSGGVVHRRCPHADTHRLLLPHSVPVRHHHSCRMGWAHAFEHAGVRVASRELLIAYGATGRSLTAAVRAGHLVRARRDHYVLPSDEGVLVSATRIGGRLGCVSALAAAGIFVLDARLPHIHIERGMSRLRSPRSRFTRLAQENRDGAQLHWWPLTDEHHVTEYSVGIVDSLAQAVRCQHPWSAIASIDNALFQRAVDVDLVAGLFRTLPERYRYLRGKVNGLAEAGQETILRMILESAGLTCELQVTVLQVGRVDMLVEGCLVLEADSRFAHDVGRGTSKIVGATLCSRARAT